MSPIKYIRAYLSRWWEIIYFSPSLINKTIHNQKGQVIFEYILLLVVILTIAYSMGKNFFLPLQKYGTSVFTGTIACALEYGQLPAEIVSEDGCEASIQARGTAGAGGSGGGRTRDRTGKDSLSDKKGADKNEKSRERESSSSESTANRSNANGGRVTSVVNRDGTLALPNSNGVEAKKGGRSEITYNIGDSQGGDGDSRFGSLGGRRPVYRTVRTELAEEVLSQKKKDRIVEVKKRSYASDGLDSEEKKQKRIQVAARRDVKKTVTADDQWNLSEILRMALIILMLIAIILFVFFQLAQMRRGQSK